jgi:carboxymethylenebutenolidase
MSGEYIKIKSNDNQEFSGYLCRPPQGKEGPGLILIQEIFGVNSHIRDVAELYAKEGFVVLAPDLFWRIQPDVQLGYEPQDMTKGIEFASKLDLNQTLDDFKEVAATLHNLSSVSGKTGAVGYCRGGYFAYYLACRGIVDAAVCYYGGGIENALDEAKNLKCPMLMHYAELDKHINAAAIDKVEAALANKSNVTIYTYPDVDHGFNCDQRGTYNRQAAMLAYGRSAAFLHKYLD